MSAKVPSLFPLIISPVTAGAHFLISLILDPAWPSKTLYLISIHPSFASFQAAPSLVCWLLLAQLLPVILQHLMHAGTCMFTPL